MSLNLCQLHSQKGRSQDSNPDVTKVLASNPTTILDYAKGTEPGSNSVYCIHYLYYLKQTNKKLNFLTLNFPMWEQTIF